MLSKVKTQSFLTNETHYLFKEISFCVFLIQVNILRNEELNCIS